MKVVLFLTLLAVYHCSDRDIIVTASNPTVQESTSYDISISFIFADPIYAGASLRITLPDQYPSVSLTSLTCTIISWPVPSASLTCILNQRKLLVSGGFPTDMTDFDQLRLFSWRISSVQNPTYAGFTGAWVGAIVDTNGVQFNNFEPSNGQGVQILPGTLSVTLSTDPKQVATSSTLTMAIETPHAIPAGAIIRITMNAYWEANALSLSPILQNSIFCNSQNNISPSVTCSYTSTANQRIVSITNGFSSGSPSTTFSLTLSPFLNPPTTQPQGSFVFSVFSPGTPLQLIDQSLPIKLAGMTPALIRTPSLALTTYEVAATTVATLTVTLSSIIARSDTIKLNFPAEISLNRLSSVASSGLLVSLQSISADNTVFLSGITSQPPNSLTLTLTSIVLPAYVTTITGVTLSTTRNNFLIDYGENMITFSTIASSMTATQTISNLQAGVQSQYTFSLTFTQSVTATSLLRIRFSAGINGYSILSAVGIGCSSSIVGSCTVTLLTANQLIVSSFALSTPITSVEIILTGITNPSTVVNSATISIESLTSSQQVVCSLTAPLSPIYITRTFQPANVVATLSNSVVRSQTNLIIAVSNNLPIQAGDILQIVIPSEMTVLPTANCDLGCTISGRTISVGPLSTVGVGALPSATISGLLTPESTAATSPIGVRIIDSSSRVKQLLVFSLRVAGTTPSLAVSSLTRSSNRNDATNVDYTFGLQTSFQASFATVGLKFTVPVSMQCVSCLSAALNANSYQFVVSGVALNGDRTISYQTSFRNHYNYAPQTIAIEIMTNDLLNKVATSSVTFSNSQASSLTATVEFVQRELQSSTTLNIRSITYPSNAIAPLSLQFSFGSDFDVSSYACPTVSYTCTITASTLRLTSLTALLPDFSIAGLISPISSPSTFVTGRLYSNGFLVGQNLIFTQWSSVCTSPCKKCSNGQPSSCLSCYQNPLLVSSQIIFRGATSTCVSECGDTYYKDSSAAIPICVSCVSPCANCIDATTCSTCQPTYLLYPVDSKCYITCPSGSFQFNTRCVQCTVGLNCYQCTDTVSCSRCGTGRYLYQGQCVLNCPTGTTVPNSIANTCDSCPSSCTVCSFNSVSSQTTCTQCATNFYLDNGACVASCLTARTIPYNGVCTVCDASCLTCAGTPTTCSSCNTASSLKFSYQGRCLGSCQLGFYGDTTLYLCLPCTQPCENCLTSSVSSCTSCISGYVLSVSTCLSSCSSGTFQKLGACNSCQSPCATCSSETSCQSCVASYYLFGNQCRLSCPVGYMPIFQKCTQCESNCYTCSPTLTTCSSCSTGFYLYETTCVATCPKGYYAAVGVTSCTACPQTCASCTSALICQQCKSGFVMGSNSLCSLGCQSTQVVISSVCIACNPKCKTCAITTNNCLQCSLTSSFPIFLSNACYATCPQTYFSDPILSICLKCTQPCQNCLTASVLTCTSCISGFSLSSSTCLSICQTGQFASNGQCLACVSPCATCLSTISCMTCISTHVLFGTTQCLTVCPTGYFSLFGKCSQCSSNCKTCSVSSVCTGCYPGSSLLGGKCYTACPNGYYLSGTAAEQQAGTSLCRECIYPCTLCSSETVCTGCTNGFILTLQNTCRSTCLTNETPINGLCIPCQSPCQTCTTSQTTCSSCLNSLYFNADTKACLTTCGTTKYALQTSMTCINSCDTGNYVDEQTITTGGRTSYVERFCNSCPSLCATCSSAILCATCKPGVFLFNGACLTVCPVEAPYVKINTFLCVSCSVTDCSLCNREKCVQCSSGLLLIGTGNGVCLSSCSAGTTYNTVTKTCDIIPTTPTATTTTGSVSQSGAGSAAYSISYVPLPFLLVSLVCWAIGLAMSLTLRTRFIPVCLASSGLLNFCCCGLTCVFIAIRITSTTDNLFKLLIGLALFMALWLIINIIVFSLRVKLSSCANWPYLVGCLINAFCATLFGANINRVNDQISKEKQFLRFWRTYRSLHKLLIVIQIGCAILGIIGALLLVSLSAGYVFFSCLELCILSVFTAIFGAIWLVQPAEAPPMMESGQSQVEELYATVSEQPTLQDMGRHESNASQPNTIIKLHDSDLRAQTAGLPPANRLNSAGDLPNADQQGAISRIMEAQSAILYPKQVMFLPKQEIPQALKYGVFRHSQESIVEKKKKREQLSEIQSAEKYFQKHKPWKDSPMQVQEVAEAPVEQEAYGDNPTPELRVRTPPLTVEAINLQFAVPTTQQQTYQINPLISPRMRVSPVLDIGDCEPVYSDFAADQQIEVNPNELKQNIIFEEVEDQDLYEDRITLRRGGQMSNDRKMDSRSAHRQGESAQKVEPLQLIFDQTRDQAYSPSPQRTHKQPFESEVMSIPVSSTQLYEAKLENQQQLNRRKRDKQNIKNNQLGQNDKKNIIQQQQNTQKQHKNEKGSPWSSFLNFFKSTPNETKELALPDKSLQAVDEPYILDGVIYAEMESVGTVEEIDLDTSGTRQGTSKGKGASRYDGKSTEPLESLGDNQDLDQNMMRPSDQLRKTQNLVSGRMQLNQRPSQNQRMRRRK